jgi:hypothetical protein
MTLACHHAPKEWPRPRQPTCRHCGVMIGPACCDACNGFGRLSGIEEKCPKCCGWRIVWRELKTILPTPANRGEAAP